MAALSEKVRSAIREAIGDTAADVDVQLLRGTICLGGTVPDPITHDRALAAARTTTAVPVQDDLLIHPGDWGEEAQPKQTEFGDRESARAMTSKDFDLLD